MFQKINNILIADGSWKYVVTGLGTTIKIAALSLVFGTILGFIVYLIRSRRSRILRVLSDAYIAILRGTPVLMLLMMMYYVILSKSPFDSVTVAIITFSMNSAAYIAEIIRTAVSAVDQGQVNAAITLGFTKAQAFRYVVLPQIVQLAKPLYESEIENLIQWTSVVGYVTITDLTRVINNIASRTMQPVVMISVGMLIYLGMAYIVKGLFALSDWIKKKRCSSKGGLQ